MPRATNRLIKEKKNEILGLLGTLYVTGDITEAEYDRESAILNRKPRLEQLETFAEELYDRVERMETFLEESNRLGRIEPIVEEGEAMNKQYAWYSYRARNRVIRDPIEFLDTIATTLPGRLRDKVRQLNAIKVRLTFICRYLKVSDEEVWITKHIYSDYFVITRSRNVEEELRNQMQLMQEQMAIVDSYRLAKIEILRVVVMSYAPLGGCYMHTPAWIKAKRATLNIKNIDDNCCFKYAILASLHRGEINTHKANNPLQYRKWVDELDFTGISFPVECEASIIDRFEAQNPGISVNIYGSDNAKETFYPLHLSSNPKQKKKINLLLIEEEGKGHYITIMSLSRLLKTTFDKGSQGKIYYCDTCLSRFRTEEKLAAHTESNRCIDWRLSKGKCPEPGKCIKYGLEHLRKTVWLPVICYMKVSHRSIEIDEHTRKQEIDRASLRIVLGKEVSEYECNDIGSVFELLSKIRPIIIEMLFMNIPMEPLTESQMMSYKGTRTCYLCNERFSKENFPVRDHDHQTGEFIGKACRNCNLHRRISKQTKVAIVVDNMDTCGHDIFRKIAEQDDNLRVEFLSKNFDQYLSLQWGMFKFIDASHFMDFQTANVDDLMKKFETFRKLSYNEYGLDPAHYVSAPGLSWDAMLKHTKVSIEQISNVEQYEFIEKGIRGGFATMPKRHAKATENEHILLLDANNLYGYALSQELPIGDFRWEEGLSLLPGRSSFAEVDLSYPEHLKDHFDFPLIVNKETVTYEMLGEYQQKLFDLTGEKVNKDPILTATFYPKKNYVIAHPLLKYLVWMGVKIDKVHRVLSFKTQAFMKSYIDLNTRLRQEAANKFEADFFKLMNNSIYGKCLESCRGRSVVKIANSEKLFKKYAASPLVKATNMINEKAVAFEMYSKHVKLDKPVSIGAFVLDLAKLRNYEFFYDVIRSKWSKAELLFHDTDSFALLVKSEKIQEDLKDISYHLDLSNYPREDGLYNTQNRMVPGKYKNEYPECIIEEYVGLRPKLYAFKTRLGDRVKMSGTSKKADVHFEDFKRCLFMGVSKTVPITMKRHKDHELFNVQTRRLALSQLDCKRKMLSDGIHSLPFGI